MASPAIVLVRPQLGENIGAAARAMMNFGLPEMRLVAPRDGWPNESARAMASRADAVLDAAALFPDTAAAVGDCHRIYATTARRREMVKPEVTPRRAAQEITADLAAGRQVAILFGPERAGLDNDDVVLADRIITIPVDPKFRSINLAQAVLLVGYELFVAGSAGPDYRFDFDAERTHPATAQEIDSLFQRLSQALDAVGYFNAVPEKRPSMLRNLRNILQRAELLEQDVRSLHGVIRALQGRNTPS